MKVFTDTNIFVAALTDEPQRGEIAAEFLDAGEKSAIITESTASEGEFEFYTSLINLMGLRTVLTKQKRHELERANQAVDRITDDVDLLILHRGYGERECRAARNAALPHRRLAACAR